MELRTMHNFPKLCWILRWRCLQKVEQRLLELWTETEEGLNRMQKDMDDAIQHLEVQLEDLCSKFGSTPLHPASELPFYGDSTHGNFVLSLATPPQKSKI